MHSAEILIKAHFHDLDPMEVVWHGNYTRYLEQARCALLDSISYNYTEMRQSGFAWPIVDLHIKYVRPIRFGQEVVIAAAIVEFQNRLKIEYRIRDRISGEVLTKATSIQVAVSLESGEMQLESPPVLLSKLEAFP